MHLEFQLAEHLLELELGNFYVGFGQVDLRFPLAAQQDQLLQLEAFLSGIIDMEGLFILRVVSIQVGRENGVRVKPCLDNLGLLRIDVHRRGQEAVVVSDEQAVGLPDIDTQGICSPEVLYAKT